MEEDYKSLGMEKEYMEDVVIYNLNKFIEYCNTSHNFEYDYDFKQHKEVATYIENLLTRYKEERDLRIHYENRLDNMERLYIDKDKVKEKIEELRKRGVKLIAEQK